MISKSNVKCTDSNVKFADSEVRMASIIKKIRMACIIKQLLDSVFVISGIILLTVDPFNCINGTLPSLLVIFSIVY